MTGKDGQTGTPVAIATQRPPRVSAAARSQQQLLWVLFDGSPESPQPSSSSLGFGDLVFSARIQILSKSPSFAVKTHIGGLHEVSAFQRASHVLLSVI